ncbi:uncharacterized protein BT62DRAFT_1011682 [Guyanagaster necrorhizus]|uniref:Uncharacterized protein n=1 Tax=Guyanagaster necrorhizus TaxID=856835 RepID=A0A9P8AP21_9AGAR|nr:uncharacterized protein BT62DRAFT_1011682 [Guyanagaster necrorhizus MCA 3950]KAG7441427.1 hypothetical protein BT62DRAFT_1011682 [Guyanagaster necrorhizus MCA 3950]
MTIPSPIRVTRGGTGRSSKRIFSDILKGGPKEPYSRTLPKRKKKPSVGEKRMRQYLMPALSRNQKRWADYPFALTHIDIEHQVTLIDWDNTC